MHPELIDRTDGDEARQRDEMTALRLQAGAGVDLPEHEIDDKPAELRGDAGYCRHFLGKSGITSGQAVQDLETTGVTV